MTHAVRRFSLVFATAALCIPLGAADCIGPITPVDDEPLPCELDTDCPGLEQCHPTLLVCEAECIDDLDCDGDRPTCNIKASEDEPYIIEADGIRDLCVCNENSCAEGEECSMETGLCIPADANTCDPANNGSDCPAEMPFCDAGVCKAGCDSEEELRLMCSEDQNCDAGTGTCVELCTVGEENPDNGDEVCGVNGTFEAYCDDDTCLDANQLCEPDSEYETFNQCDDPDSVIGYCDAADAFPSLRDDDGPVIYELDYERDSSLDGDCDSAVSGTMGYLVSFFYWSEADEAYDSQNPDSYAAFKWAEPDGSPLVSTLALGFSDDADSTSGVAVMTICFASAPDQLAIQIEDKTGAKSNAGCAWLE